MKKKSPPYAIIGAVLLGAAAVFLIIKHERDAEAQKVAEEAKIKADADAAIAAAKANQGPTVTETQTNMRGVLYATQPVEPGVKISPAFYEMKLTPTEILPDAFTDKNDIVGWYAVRKIEKGDPLTPRNIGKSLPYMSQRISPGMRAVSLPIFNAGDINYTGGFVVDGDKVDLLYTVSTLSDFKIYTQTIMQNVNVLYVPGPAIKTEKTDGVNPVPTPGDTAAVTFEVTPEEAQALIFLSNAKNAHFSMILRSRRDTTEIAIKPFNITDYDLNNLKKVQKTIDKSEERVQELAAAIEAKEKTQGQGNTNETPTPTPPSP